jgi:peptidoglycan/LPS O-acetylase OafA/YrhL
VNLFFVLSGFFVSGILFKEYKIRGKMNSGRFFIRRGLKIWPLFYAAFIIILSYYFLKANAPPASQIMAEVFFFQNYKPGFIQVTWSLAIEEQFYLLIAIAFPMMVAMKRIDWIPHFCIAIMIISLTLRISHYFSFSEYDPYTFHYPLQFQADSLSAGILISWFYYFKYEEFKQWVMKNRGLLLFSLVILLLPAFLFPYFHPLIYTIGFTTIGLGYCNLVMLLIILPSANNRWNHFFNNCPLALLVAWIGFYSYAIYLFHFFIGPGVLNNFERHIWSKPPLIIKFLIFFTADILFGYVISNLIEQPILKWRNKVLPSKV